MFWCSCAAAVLVVYVLSSGPVMAICFWLREKTHWDGFYSIAFGLYLPLWWPARKWQTTLGDALKAYIVWWAGLLGTVGPG